MNETNFKNISNTWKQLVHNNGRLNIEPALRWLSQQFPGGVAFSSSFSLEDQVITDVILTHNLPIRIFTLDTGRLFSETYSVWARTKEKYSANIEAYYPNAEALQAFATAKGPNSFYESVENRKECCHIRKVEPLERALKNCEVWVTGLRAEHSANRSGLEQLEWDQAHGLMKYHPLLHWSSDEVREYVSAHQVPYNNLHDKGFVSIGCAPCTRAIQPGEDFRAGRWWWEEAGKKECGLHTHSTPQTTHP